MAQLLGSVLIFIGLACLSAAVAVLVGTVAFRLCHRFSRVRHLGNKARFAEVRKVTRVNTPTPVCAKSRDRATLPRAEAAPTYTPLRIRVRFHREEWLLKPSDRLSHRANWN